MVVISKLFDIAGKRIWVAGHTGMVGAAIARRLSREACEVLTVPHAEIDLTRQADVERWVAAQRPEIGRAHV